MCCSGREPAASPPGPSPEDKGSKGDSRAAWNTGVVAPFGARRASLWAGLHHAGALRLGPLPSRKGSVAVNPPHPDPGLSQVPLGLGTLVWLSLSHLTTGLRTTYSGQLRPPCPKCTGSPVHSVRKRRTYGRGQAQRDSYWPWLPLRYSLLHSFIDPFIQQTFCIPQGFGHQCLWNVLRNGQSQS